MVDDPSRLAGDRGGQPTAGHALPPVPDAPLIVLDQAAPNAIESVADRLIAGGVVSFPTDTVYALAASLSHPTALDRIFTIKGRPADKPLPVLVGGPGDLLRTALDLDNRVAAFVARYWPGQLTVVIPARGDVPHQVIGPERTVGARVPNHPLALEVIARAGGAVAATSANRSGAPPARDAIEVAADLGDALDLLLDGGRTPGGVPSTVVRFADDALIVLRDGAIPGGHLRAAWAEIVAATVRG